MAPWMAQAGACSSKGTPLCMGRRPRRRASLGPSSFCQGPSDATARKPSCDDKDLATLAWNCKTRVLAEGLKPKRRAFRGGVSKKARLLRLSLERGRIQKMCGQQGITTKTKDSITPGDPDLLGAGRLCRWKRASMLHASGPSHSIANTKMPLYLTGATEGQLIQSSFASKMAANDKRACPCAWATQLLDGAKVLGGVNLLGVAGCEFSASRTGKLSPHPPKFPALSWTDLPT